MQCLVSECTCLIEPPCLTVFVKPPFEAVYCLLSCLAYKIRKKQIFLELSVSLKRFVVLKCGVNELLRSYCSWLKYLKNKWNNHLN